MKLGFGAIVFVGFNLVLWLLLGAPGGDFIQAAWVPLLSWLVFLGMLCWSVAAFRAFRVDMATYGPVVLTLGLFIPFLSLGLAAAALLVARYAGTDAGQWAVSPQLGGVFVLLMLLSACGAYVFTNRSIGERGRRPIVDDRGTMQSHPDAPTRASDITGSAADRTPGS